MSKVKNLELTKKEAIVELYRLKKEASYIWYQIQKMEKIVLDGETVFNKKEKEVEIEL